MILFITTILLVSLSYAQNQSPVVDPNKFTVCSITINSDNEKKVFESQVKKYPKKFNPVVELTMMGTEEEDGDDWFDMACKSGLRCDQLVISGHFGGSFFGDSKKELSMEQLESKGCSRTCDGILAQPYEVFLFGCNTLASKEQDHRTPAQYLQVLLRDGIPRQQAEMVVESRYGATGDDFKSSMQRAFHGDSKQLYGFDSVGPSGKNVEGFLKNYFSKIKAPTHLEKLQAKRMMNQVDMGNSALATSLKSTAFTQCSGGSKDDPISRVVCNLRDENLSVDKKIDTMLEALSNEKFLIFVPAINSFLNENPIADMDEVHQKRLADIRNNEVLKGQIMGLLNTKNMSMALDWSAFAESFGYMDKEARLAYLTERVLSMFEDGISLDERDLICSSFGSGKDNFLPNFPVSKIKGKLKNNDLRALNCMGVEGEEVAIKALEAYESNDDDTIGAGQIYFNQQLRLDTPKVRAKLVQLIVSYPEDSKVFYKAVDSASFLSLDNNIEFQIQLLNSLDKKDNAEKIALKTTALITLLLKPDTKNIPLILEKLELIAGADVSGQSVRNTYYLLEMKIRNLDKENILKLLDIYAKYPKKIPKDFFPKLMTAAGFDSDVKKKYDEVSEIIKNAQ